MRGLSLVVASGGHSSLRCAGLSLSWPLFAEHRLQTRRLSSCGSRALVAPWHVGSSQTRARTRVPCIGRQILNHCATREAQRIHFYITKKIYEFPIFTFSNISSYVFIDNEILEQMSTLLVFLSLHFPC